MEGRDLGTVTIPVKGMTCASCVIRVERALSRHGSVSDARFNFAAEKATVDYEPGTTSPEKLVENIRSAGYDADVREMAFDVAGMSCASCVGRVEGRSRRLAR